MLAVRLPPQIEKRLTRLAKKTGRTKTAYVREAILEQIDHLEDVHLAEKSLLEMHKNGSVLSMEEVLERYGL